MQRLRPLHIAAAVCVLIIIAGTPGASRVASGAGMVYAAAAAAGDSLSGRNEKLLMYERSFRPSTYDAPVTAPASGGTAARAAASAGYVSYAAPETVQGFRIQVLNSNSYDEAATTRNALLAAFDKWWVYVMFDTPTYRVRIGDFRSRLEAKRVLEQVQAKGYPAAWLVPDKVVLHLPARLPLPQPIDSTHVQ